MQALDSINPPRIRIMTDDIPIKQALVTLRPAAGGWRWLLDKPLAGLPVLDRLLFTLGRAGVEHVVIYAPDLPREKQNEITRRLAGDTRLQTRLTWFSENPGAELLENQPCLCLAGNSVTTPHTLKEIFKRAQPPLQSRRAVHYAGGGPGACLILPAFDPNRTDAFKADQAPPEEPVLQQAEDLFKTVEDAAGFRAAERALLSHHRRHYTQLLDVHLNSHLSLPISSFLVRLPVTPNQLTLLGLIIGAAAGWLFARGDYLSGLMGGALLVFTAVWDCCDGDVARLKFMESDFGETLDTFCDNLINVFVFTGMAWGVARTHGAAYALTPFVLLAVGGLSIFVLIYFPKGGKGNFFKGTPMYDVILLLASRNFIYIIAGFALIGRLDWFLWLAGIGSLVFAAILGWEKRKLVLAGRP